MQLTYLSLFSGAGGGDLGALLLGWRCRGYVEQDEYCCKILEQRIRDGIFEDAPIFQGDIRKWIELGYAGRYRGMVDVVTAGFPCQPFSVAGKKLGDQDDRNMWPETIAVIRAVRPKFALLENVPGLLAHEYIRVIFGDLAESGYDCRWRCLSAGEVGAPHKRDRLWIVADSTGHRRSKERSREPTSPSEDMANPDSQGLQDRRQAGQPTGESETIRPVAQPESERCGDAWWAVEPDVGRVANGVARRVDRIKALGNGQVWKLLNDRG